MCGKTFRRAEAGPAGLVQRGLLSLTPLMAATSSPGEHPHQAEFRHADVVVRPMFPRCAEGQSSRGIGPVRVLCNNAGVGSGMAGMNLETMKYEHWDHTLGVNLGGVVNGIQTFVPRMVERGGPAHVVNTSSGSGLAVTGGAQFMYCASKYAVTGLSEAIANLLQRYGIGLTLVSPGFVDTRIAETTRRLDPAAAEAEAMDPDYREKLERFEALFEPLGQDPDDVGMMVLDAIHNNQLYCQPDRLMAEPIRARCAALLEAMPAKTERDRAMVEMIAKARQ